MLNAHISVRWRHSLRKVTPAFYPRSKVTKPFSGIESYVNHCRQQLSSSWVCNRNVYLKTISVSWNLVRLSLLTLLTVLIFRVMFMWSLIFALVLVNFKMCSWIFRETRRWCNSSETTLKTSTFWEARLCEGPRKVELLTEIGSQYKCTPEDVKNMWFFVQRKRSPYPAKDEYTRLMGEFKAVNLVKVPTRVQGRLFDLVKKAQSLNASAPSD